MKTFYKKPASEVQIFGEVYICNHPLYTSCTLYKFGVHGLAVVQRRFDPVTRHTWWSEVDPWLCNDLYLSKKFREYFESHSSMKDENGLYNTVEVRKMMWALGLCPMKLESWEKGFE